MTQFKEAVSLINFFGGQIFGRMVDDSRLPFTEITG
jgi:hypothetical protein